MSIFLTVLFILFVIKVTLRFIRLSLNIAAGIICTFLLLFIAAIIIALLSYVIEIFKASLLVFVIAGFVIMSAFLVKKISRRRLCSYKNNI